MKKIVTLTAAFAVTAFLAACGGASPEKVCNHVMELAKKEFADLTKDMPEEAKKDMEKEMKEGVEKCVKEAGEEMKKDAAGFTKKAECMLKATKLEEAMKCDDKK